MPLSKRVRFDVFKRDDFTCQYCGRRTPDVVLEVDHIIPRAESGGDELENLTTCCFDCNRGKAAFPLTNPTAVDDIAERTRLMAEREDQLRAYHDILNARATRMNDDFERVYNAWFEVWEVTSLERWHMPWESTLRKYIDLLGPDMVIEAMRIAKAKRNGWITSASVKYFAGILKRMHADLEGRPR